MRGGLQPGSPNSESFEVDIAAPNAVPRALAPLEFHHLKNLLVSLGG